MSKNESEPGFWNGLSLSFVAGLRVVDAVRSDDGSWYTVAKGMRVHLAKDDDDFRELVRRAVAWKKAQTAPVVYEPPSAPKVRKVRVRNGEHLLDAPCMACGSYGCEGGCVR